MQAAKCSCGKDYRGGKEDGCKGRGSGREMEGEGGQMRHVGAVFGRVKCRHA